MMKYKIIKETLTHPDIGTYTTYGIIIRKRGSVIRTISDVTTNKKELRKLCRLCNKLRLAPEHIEDVISDNLYV